MKRMPFEPPTEHYDKQIESLDEQICNLIKQRKELSNNNPGFPTKELIAKWSLKYNFYEDFLNSVFSHFLNEDIYKPVVEPEGFIKNLPMLKSFEKDGIFYTVTFVRQFNNASVVHFTIDREDLDEEPRRFQEHSFFDLSIEGVGVDYDCRNNFGGGSGTHESFTFTVSPALPNNLSNIKLIFKEYKHPFQKQKPTGFEFVIQMDN
ncbi:FlxA-like family protein [Heyndrickxia oleronia]|uniref:FlxA-like family protein n=1 Tax=Heyndrickxia oleronia TaxID=38875 RepID=UPI000903B204|nr:FlxA-like family protein [Heyndrickxia oleronia]MEC1377602.1 FlxA-like family protein [Heyndrickxia oleronia]OJH17580.1 hypothetical protein BLX88_17140 [Bacillus obstructivus]QQZ03584.1 hypothetical protein I5818_17745 [Heyndrickxia oleronia]